MVDKDNELRDKIEESIETLMYCLGQRDDSDNWWGHNTNVGTLEDEIETASSSILKLIKSRESKLVREARIDELEKLLDAHLLEPDCGAEIYLQEGINQLQKERDANE